MFTETSRCIFESCLARVGHRQQGERGMGSRIIVARQRSTEFQRRRHSYARRCRRNGQKSQGKSSIYSERTELTLKCFPGKCQRTTESNVRRDDGSTTGPRRRSSRAASNAADNAVDDHEQNPIRY